MGIWLDAGVVSESIKMRKWPLFEESKKKGKKKGDFEEWLIIVVVEKSTMRIVAAVTSTSKRPGTAYSGRQPTTAFDNLW